MNQDKSRRGLLLLLLVVATLAMAESTARAQSEPGWAPSADDVWIHAPAIVEGSLGPVHRTVRMTRALPRDRASLQLWRSHVRKKEGRLVIMQGLVQAVVKKVSEGLDSLQ